MAKIAFLPPGKVYLNNEMFNENNAILNRDNSCDHYIKFKQLNYNINTIDLYDYREINLLIAYRVDFNLKYILDLIKVNPKVKIIYIMSEPEIVCPMHQKEIIEKLPFDSVFTWNDKVIDGKKFKKLNYVNPKINIDEIPNIPYEKKKFITLIAGNKTSPVKNELYSERIKAIKFFANTKEGIEFYGVGWDNVKDEILKKAYKGKVKTKKDVLRNYKFTICYENAKGLYGYITEKIFDCFAAGTVPIYWGAENITDYIPKKCFIDFRDFRSYDDLYQYLINMSEKEYNDYLDAVKDYIQNDKRYYYFTSQCYVDILSAEIEKLLQKNTNKNYWKIKFELLKLISKNPLFYLKYHKKFLFDSVVG